MAVGARSIADFVLLKDPEALVRIVGVEPVPPGLVHLELGPVRPGEHSRGGAGHVAVADHVGGVGHPDPHLGAAGQEVFRGQEWQR